MKSLWLIILSGILWAGPIDNPTQETESSAPLILGTSAKEIVIGQQDRFETSLGYEYLDPNDIYGAWKSLNLSYYQKYSQDLTLVYQAGLFGRDEGNAALFALELTKTGPLLSIRFHRLQSEQTVNIYLSTD